MNCMNRCPLFTALFCLTLAPLCAQYKFQMPDPVTPTPTPMPGGPITYVGLDLHHVQKWDNSNGDSWDFAWADDDNLYSFGCDGKGFGSTPRNVNFNSLSGPDLAHLTGDSVNTMPSYGAASEHAGDHATWKASSTECIDGVLYAFVVRDTYGNESGDPQLRQTSVNASLIKSTDKGITWVRNERENFDRPMWPGSRFGSPCFVHMGKNGGPNDEMNRYVYAVSNNGFWNNGDDLILARVPKVAIGELHASDWSYYRGGDGSQDTAWSSYIAEAKPVMEQAGKIGWNCPCYLPELNTYLFISWYVTPKLNQWFVPKQIRYDFYQAHKPWGPYTYISSTTDSFLQGAHMYGPNICAKYQGSTGSGKDLSVIMFTSGCPFQSSPDGLYKCWEIPLILHTSPLPPVQIVFHDDPRITYTGQWLNHIVFGPDSEPFHYTREAGDTIQFPFKGTGIDILSDMYGDQGSLGILIDGQPRDNVSLKMSNFPRINNATVFSAHDLAPGDHTIKIVNETNDFVNVSAFRVFGAPSPTPTPAPTFH